MTPRCPSARSRRCSRRPTRNGGPTTSGSRTCAALTARASRDVLEAMQTLGADDDPTTRELAAFVARPARHLAVSAFPEEQAQALLDMAQRERDPRVIAAIAYAFGHLGEPHGHAWVLSLRDHESPEIREAVAFALGGRKTDDAVDALIGLSADDSARPSATGRRSRSARSRIATATGAARSARRAAGGPGRGHAPGGRPRSRAPPRRARRRGCARADRPGPGGLRDLASAPAGRDGRAPRRVRRPTYFSRQRGIHASAGVPAVNDSGRPCERPRYSR